MLKLPFHACHFMYYIPASQTPSKYCIFAVQI
jgi:hypothetical protein